MNNNKRRDNLFIAVPPTQQSSYPDRIPPPLDPMGEIHVRARALRTLGGGDVHWWVLISGWLFFGSTFLLFTLLVISTQSYILIFPMAISAIPLVSLWRGTTKKLSRRKLGRTY